MATAPAYRATRRPTRRRSDDGAFLYRHEITHAAFVLDAPDFGPGESIGKRDGLIERENHEHFDRPGNETPAFKSLAQIDGTVQGVHLPFERTSRPCEMGDLLVDDLVFPAGRQIGKGYHPVCVRPVRRLPEEMRQRLNEHAGADEAPGL